MKKFGIALISLGLYCIVFAFNMDVVVGTTYNIGLLNERQNVIYVSGIIFLAGIILFGFGFLSKEESKNFRLFAISCFLLPMILIILCISIIKVSTLKRISDEQNVTLKDEKTGLIWMKCSLGQKWNGTNCVGEALMMYWNDADLITKKFNIENFSGHNDWRLPSRAELESLIFCENGYYDNKCKGASYSKAIIGVEFSNTPALNFWSSSVDNKSAWIVSFYDGSHGRIDKEQLACARLVRNK